MQDESLSRSMDPEAFVGMTCTVLQRTHAIGEADRDSFMKYTFLKTRNLICKKFVFKFEVWYSWLKNGRFTQYY